MKAEDTHNLIRAKRPALTIISCNPKMTKTNGADMHNPVLQQGNLYKWNLTKKLLANPTHQDGNPRTVISCADS